MVQLYIANGVDEGVLRRSMTPVDGHLMCAFHLDCIERWRVASIYCSAHHREVAHEFLTRSSCKKAKEFTSPVYHSVWKSDNVFRGLRRRGRYNRRDGQRIGPDLSSNQVVHPVVQSVRMPA